jgi:hypothetical protein
MGIKDTLEFEETDFDPKVDSLLSLNKKIKDSGLLFHPFMVIQAIDNEKQRQFSEIVMDHFRGMRVSKLEECKEEIAKYLEEEQNRYNDFMKSKNTVKYANDPIIEECQNNDIVVAPKKRQKKSK